MSENNARLFAITELKDVVSQLENLLSRFKTGNSIQLTRAVEDRVSQANAAFSGSWLGWHSRTYLDKLESKRPGDHFDPIFGVEPLIGKTKGNWIEFSSEYIYDYVAGSELKALIELSRGDYIKSLLFQQNDLVSILSTLENDSYLNQMIDEVKALRLFSATEIAQSLSPSGRTTTKDMRAVGEGTQLPPHIKAHCELEGIKTTVALGDALIEITTRATKHLTRKHAAKTGGIVTATINDEATIFIGHGGSPLWRNLAMFFTDTLNLKYQEYNSVATAGFSRKERLLQLLDQCSFAVIIMTAEDQTADGDLRARQNVIHEIGLFQGRLGFTKAIVMLENTCTDFSNIDGLDQIRFAEGNVLSESEQIRGVLQREGLLQ